MRCLSVWLALIAACNGSSSSTDGGTDSSVANDAGNDAAREDASASDASDAESGADAGNGYDGGVVNGCIAFVDDTADGGLLVGPTTQPPAQYVPNCVHIKV